MIEPDYYIVFKYNEEIQVKAKLSSHSSFTIREIKVKLLHMVLIKKLDTFLYQNQDNLISLFFHYMERNKRRRLNRLTIHMTYNG
jgi:hypothetical protein